MIRTAIVLAAIMVHPRPASAATSCESLASLSLPQTMITSAQMVAAGQFILPAEGSQPAPAAFKDAPAFCRITATLKPTSDSDIKIEVWLPAAAWNGNFQGVGNDGGTISYPVMAGVLRNGFATAGTDTGHVGTGMGFAPGHPEKVKDFAYRGFHEMTLKAKAITSAFYGSGPKLSYLNDCGGGSREALAEAQRYPADYDGIAASGLGTHKSIHHIAQFWVWQATHKDEASYIPPAKYPLIHEAALETCDVQVDGVKDGLIEDPSRCRFDPKVLECKGADGPACLTSPQVEAARKIYAPPVHARTKKEIFSPLYPGSELSWAGAVGPNASGAGVEYFKYVVFEDPNWDYKTKPINFDSDVDLATSPEKSIVNATNPDLSGFLRRGGKLLLVEGWNDTAIPPRVAIDYYKSVVEKLGNTKEVRDGLRLFMVPGMGHCPGINGTENFDLDTLGTLRQWRENGKAPDQMLATRYKNGKEIGKRLVCQYPQVPVYRGSGSADDAANFSCSLPK